MCPKNVAAAICEVSVFIFDIVSPEYNSSFVFLEECCKFCILQVTEVRQVREMDCVSVILRALNNFSLVFKRSFQRSCQPATFSTFSHPLFAAAVASGILIAS